MVLWITGGNGVFETQEQFMARTAEYQALFAKGPVTGVNENRELITFANIIFLALIPLVFYLPRLLIYPMTASSIYMHERAWNSWTADILKTGINDPNQNIANYYPELIELGLVTLALFILLFISRKQVLFDMRRLAAATNLRFLQR